MPSFPDVADGLDRLGCAGHRLAVLTNSAADAADSALAAAGRRTGYVEREGPLPPGVTVDAAAPDLGGIAVALGG